MLFALVPLQQFAGKQMPLLSVDPGVTDAEYNSWFESSPAGSYNHGNPDTVSRSDLSCLMAGVARVLLRALLRPWCPL
jgi:hypothetical protein